MTKFSDLLKVAPELEGLAARADGHQLMPAPYAEPLSDSLYTPSAVGDCPQVFDNYGDFEPSVDLLPWMSDFCSFIQQQIPYATIRLVSARTWDQNATSKIMLSIDGAPIVASRSLHTLLSDYMVLTTITVGPTDVGFRMILSNRDDRDEWRHKREKLCRVLKHLDWYVPYSWVPVDFAPA